MAALQHEVDTLHETIEAEHGAEEAGHPRDPPAPAQQTHSHSHTHFMTHIMIHIILLPIKLLESLADMWSTGT